MPQNDSPQARYEAYVHQTEHLPEKLRTSILKELEEIRRREEHVRGVLERLEASSAEQVFHSLSFPNVPRAE